MRAEHVVLSTNRDRRIGVVDTTACASSQATSFSRASRKPAEARTASSDAPIGDTCRREPRGVRMPDPHEYVIREWREVDTERFDSFVRLIKAKG